MAATETKRKYVGKNRDCSVQQETGAVFPGGGGVRLETACLDDTTDYEPRVTVRARWNALCSRVS